MADRIAKTGIGVDDLKSSELYGKLIQASNEETPFSDDEILRKLFAAEDFYEHDLQLFWQPTRVISAPQLRALSIDPYVQLSPAYDPTVDMQGVAFDYEVGMFDEARWGDVQLDYRPIISVDKAFFWYPGTAVGSSWKVPLDWVRLDYRFGNLQLVPATGAMLQFLSLNSFVLSSLAGGRTVPQSIFVDYYAGFEAGVLEAKHQDLLEGVRLHTLLLLFGMISSVRSHGLGSASLSLDGGSQSNNYMAGRYGPYSAEVELALRNEADIRKVWKQTNEAPIVAFI